MTAPSSHPRPADPDRTVAGDLSGRIDDPDPVPTMPQSADEPLSGTEWPTMPGYQILGVLGRGGMGVVYKARQVGLGRYVALKMILGGAHASPEDMVRFLAEGEAVARLQHTNIVQIHQIGKHGDVPFFSLEYVDGGTLAERLNGVPQSPRATAGLIESLARAMQLAHQCGIVHRDLKPSNILLASGGRKPPGADELASGGRKPPDVDELASGGRKPPGRTNQQGRKPPARRLPCQNHRLRLGQTSRGRRRIDANRRNPGHTQLHGPRTGRR